MSTLSAGSVHSMNSGRTDMSPNVQLLDIKRIASNSAASQDRFRLVISDGQHYMQAMLATQLNYIVEQNQVEQYSVVQLQEYICNMVQNRKIVIALRLQPVQKHTQQIGNPQKLDEGGGPPPAQQQQAPPAYPAAPQQQGYAPPPPRRKLPQPPCVRLPSGPGR
jgi:replication factor A1